MKTKIYNTKVLKEVKGLTYSKRIPKKLLNVSNKDFLSNKKLVKKYGLYGDIDKDFVPNLVDCKPFNRQRAGILSTLFPGNPISSFLSSVWGSGTPSPISLATGGRVGGVGEGTIIGSAGSVNVGTTGGYSGGGGSVGSGGYSGGGGSVSSGTSTATQTTATQQQAQKQNVQLSNTQTNQVQNYQQYLARQNLKAGTFYQTNPSVSGLGYAPILRTIDYAGEKGSKAIVPEREIGYYYKPENFFRSGGLKAGEGTGGKGTLAYPTSVTQLTTADNEIFNTNTFDYRVKNIEAGARAGARSFIETAPYFIPYAGEVLLIGGSVESYTTPYGRGKIKETSEQLQKAGLNQRTSNVFAYSLPAVQGVLGGFGLKARISNIPRNDVFFTGYSQQKQGNIVRTELDFITSKKEVGIATGISKVSSGSVPLYQDVLNIGGKEVGTITHSADINVFGTRIFGESVKGSKTSKFAGIDVGLGRNVENKFIDISKGVSSRYNIGLKFPSGKLFLKVASPKSYQSLSIGGRFREDLTAITGGSVGKGTTGRFGGIIKDVENIPMSFKDTNFIDFLKRGKQNLISEQALKSTASVVSSVFSSPKSFPKITSTTSSNVIKTILPRETKTTSLYAGLNLYERTEGGLIPSLKDITSTKNVLFLSQPGASSFKSIGRLTSIPALKDITSERYTQKYIQSPRETQQYRYRYAQKQVQLSRQTYRQAKIFPRATGKGFKGILLPQLKGGVNLKSSGGLFGVSVRRRGKFKTIGIFGSYAEAFEKGTFLTRTSLARSFKISGTPRTAQLPRDFYLSRKEPLTFIEKRRFSLNTPTEKREIKSYRRKTKRGFSLF